MWGALKQGRLHPIGNAKSPELTLPHQVVMLREADVLPRNVCHGVISLGDVACHNPSFGCNPNARNRSVAGKNADAESR